MQLPDCRNDAYYNEDFLDETGKLRVSGYDFCTEAAVDSFFDNMDIYFERDSYIGHILNEKVPESMREEYEVETASGEDKTRKIRTYGDYLRSCILDYIATNRDELITSLIDDMDEDLYKEIRRKVLEDNKISANPKVYYDTRSFKHKPVEE